MMENNKMKIVISILIGAIIIGGSIAGFYILSNNDEKDDKKISIFEAEINILSPQAGCHKNSSQLINIEVLKNESTLKIFYNWDGTNITYNVPHFVEFPEGTQILYVYVEDLDGNQKKASCEFTIQSEFVSTWDTRLRREVAYDPENPDIPIEEECSPIDSIKLPLVENGLYDFYINWGDGTNNHIIEWNQAQIQHQYPNEGIYTIRIKGSILGWRFNDFVDKLKIVEISQWGNLKLGNDKNYFKGCSNLVLTANDSLDTTTTTDFTSMFELAINLGNRGTMDDWDMSKATYLSKMFSGATSFNQIISSWNTTSVIDMDSMFQGCQYFNQYVGNWDVSNVKNMNMMFFNASLFNQDISNWDTSNVWFFSGMFFYATSFNQPLNSWNTSSAYNMANMFRSAISFNQPLNSWNVSRVNLMVGMFHNATSFNHPLNYWNVSYVEDMQEMFRGAISFNQNIGGWNITNVRKMNNMFTDASLSTPNYDALLLGWSSLPIQFAVVFHAGNSYYSMISTIIDARETLINYGWTIIDAGCV